MDDQVQSLVYLKPHLLHHFRLQGCQAGLANTPNIRCTPTQKATKKHHIALKTIPLLQGDHRNGSTGFDGDVTSNQVAYLESIDTCFFVIDPLLFVSRMRAIASDGVRVQAVRSVELQNKCATFFSMVVRDTVRREQFFFPNR